MCGSIVDGLMELDLDLGKSPTTTSHALRTRTDRDLLQSRMGHPGLVPFSIIFPGISPPESCEPCILLKHHRLPYPGKFKVPKERLEQLHIDLSGLISPTSMGGHRHYSKITDSATSYKFVYLLRQTSETLETFKKFETFIENQSNCKIKTLLNDNSGEYTVIHTPSSISSINMVFRCCSLLHTRYSSIPGKPNSSGLT